MSLGTAPCLLEGMIDVVDEITDLFDSDGRSHYKLGDAKLVTWCQAVAGLVCLNRRPMKWVF